jgi:hypothetical protein
MYGTLNENVFYRTTFRTRNVFTDVLKLTNYHTVIFFCSKINSNKNVRVARFLFQHTKMAKMHQMTTKYTKVPSNKPNDSKTFQLTIINTTISHQNTPK